MLTRNDGRAPEMGRPVTIETDFVRTADGSCLICTGNTKVICTASVEENVPPFLRGKGQGWVTAEYAMLPASTGHRKQRDGVKTPCAVNGDRCYDCKSPQRICRGLVVLWEAIRSCETEVVLVDEPLGY